MRKADLLMGVAMLLCNLLYAQTGITGRVTDSKDRTPIPNATVKIKCGGATVTDTDGKFTLPGTAAGETLEIGSSATRNPK